jgi:hypothetical protein
MQLARVRRLLVFKPKHRCRLEGNTAVATLPFPARLFPDFEGAGTQAPSFCPSNDNTSPSDYHLARV